MNGVHDLGGMQGFGPVEREANEPAFHEPWEGRVFAMRSLLRSYGHWNIDEGRHAIERMDPVAYLAASYYERWRVTLEELCVAKGLIDPADLDARAAALAAGEWQPPATSTHAGPPVARPIERYRRPGPEPRFQVGDAVLTSRAQPAGHTRLPRYARGCRGVIDRVHGVFVLPDTNAHGQGEQPEPVYSVRFSGAELWGESSEPHAAVYLDLWERYLAPA